MTPVLTPSLPVSLPTPAPVSPPAVTSPPVVVQPPPQPFRWTLEKYRELDKIGFFNDKRTMLIDGVIYAMPNPKPPHSGVLSMVNTWARGVFAAGHSVRVQMPLEIGGDTEPNPDLAVVVGSDRDFVVVNPTTAVLIVEVSDSTLFTDVTTKAEKYATAGVQDYWVIDLEHRELVVFRDPVPLPAGLGATAYRQRNTFGPDAVISPLAAPHAAVKVADLLP
jgi:Uma2 family endonuclease